MSIDPDFKSESSSFVSMVRSLFVLSEFLYFTELERPDIIDLICHNGARRFESFDLNVSIAWIQEATS
jgi:hypothetical protein